MKINDIHERIGGEIINLNNDNELTGVTTWEAASKSDIVFLFNKNTDITSTNAGLVVTTEPILHLNNAQIIHKKPRAAMCDILTLLFPYAKEVVHSISKQAVIEASATLKTPVEIKAFSYVGNKSKIGKNTYIGPNVSIGNNCTIGDNCIIHPQVVVYDNVAIGNGTIIHAGAVIGGDGFGYEHQNNEWVKIPHIGSVLIGENVEIGANTNIDRGCLAKTIISDGVKIDNLVHVAHNVSIGKNTAIAGGVLIGGSASIGEQCQIAGDVSVADNIKVGNSVIILGKSGVTKDIKDNDIISGYPAQNHKKEIKFQARIRKKLNQLIENCD